MQSAVRIGVSCLAAAAAATTSAALGAGPVATGIAVAIATLAAAAVLAHWSGDLPWRAGPSGTGGGGEDGAREADFALLADLPQAVILLDRGALILFANAAAESLFGPVPRGEPMSSVVRARALIDAVSAVVAGGQAAQVEFTHVRARGERTLHAHIRPVAPARGGPGPAVMAVVEDRSREAQVEQMRRDFIANASHELKTPLASIAGFIETLQGPARNDAKATERFLPIMAQQAERMKRLVEDLMSLNRIEMNQHVRPAGEVELRGLLRETAAALHPLAEKAGVKIDIDLPDGPMRVTGERDDLGRLFINLIDNAIKHGGSGGTVRIEPAPDEPGRARLIGISVTDQGPGIAREHIPRLTERFYRVAEPRTKQASGTGLGLSIVKHILNRHGGDLTIRSSPGQGATFTAWLPRAPEAESAVSDRGNRRV